jgi:hypothetical protein
MYSFFHGYDNYPLLLWYLKGKLYYLVFSTIIQYTYSASSRCTLQCTVHMYSFPLGYSYGKNFVLVSIAFAFSLNNTIFFGCIKLCAFQQVFRILLTAFQLGIALNRILYFSFHFDEIYINKNFS